MAVMKIMSVKLSIKDKERLKAITPPRQSMSAIIRLLIKQKYNQVEGD